MPGPIQSGVSQGPQPASNIAKAQTGDLNGSSVTALKQPDPKLAGLDQNKTSDTSLGDRTAQKTDTPQSKQENELEEARKARANHSLEELETEQKELLKEAEEKIKKVEEHIVLDNALAALSGLDKPRNDLKITIQLPGEDKAIQLIPPDKKALKGKDVKALTELAKQVLSDYKSNNFTGFDPRPINQRIDTIKDMLNDLNKAITNKGKAGNDGPKQFEDLKNKDVKIVAYEQEPDNSVKPDDHRPLKRPVVQIEKRASEKTS